MNEQTRGLIALFCLLPPILIALPAIFILSEAMLPDLLEQSRVHLARRPRRSFFTGLVNGFFLLVLTAVLSSSGVGLLGLVGLVFLLALLLLGVAGFGALAGTVGDRIFALWERPASPGARLVVGSWVLEALLFVPLVGWLMLIIFGLGGFGASLIALWRRRRRSAQLEGT